MEFHFQDMANSIAQIEFYILIVNVTNQQLLSITKNMPIIFKIFLIHHYSFCVVKFLLQ